LLTDKTKSTYNDKQVSRLRCRRRMHIPLAMKLAWHRHHSTSARASVAS